MNNNYGWVPLLIMAFASCLARLLWLIINKNKVNEVFDELDKPDLTWKQRIAVFLIDLKKLVPPVLLRIFQFELKDVHLRLAGWSISTDEFTGIQALALIVGVAIALVLKVTGAIPLLMACLIPIILFAIPSGLLEKSAKTNREIIRESAAEFIETLAVGTSSGKDVERVIFYLAKNSTESPLSAELKVVADQISMGKPTREALEEMAQRLDIPEIDDLVSMMKDSNAFGVSLYKQLKDLAKEIRKDREDEALEKAEKAETNITTPIVLFTVPSATILLVGPMALSLARAFGR